MMCAWWLYGWVAPSWLTIDFATVHHRHQPVSQICEGFALTRVSQDVCDKVGSSDTGAKDAVAAMIKRLAHRNANVQLYTLELANALSQNCGNQMHKELASRSFTEAMLRLAGDRNTHQAVKAKILERMAEWTEMFARDPDLGIMEGAYMKLKTQSQFNESLLLN
jgi:hypothetical protein